MSDRKAFLAFSGKNKLRTLIRLVNFGEKRQDRSMTPDQLDDALHDIRWTPDILARALECDVSLIHAWLNGNAEIPMKVGVWIKVIAEHHRAFEETKPAGVKGKRHLE